MNGRSKLLGKRGNAKPGVFEGMLQMETFVNRTGDRNYIPFPSGLEVAIYKQ